VVSYVRSAYWVFGDMERLRKVMDVRLNGGAGSAFWLEGGCNGKGRREGGDVRGEMRREGKWEGREEGR
jgi:hypothetical protein